jgi:hypothetical protein
VEFRRPSFTVSPLWQVPDELDPPLLPEPLALDESSELHAPANSASAATAARTTINGRKRVFEDIDVSLHLVPKCTSGGNLRNVGVGSLSVLFPDHDTTLDAL